MDSAVIVKEPARPTIDERRKELAVLPTEIRRRISHRVEFEEIDAPSPADIVYWSNPDPMMLSAFKYLSRDVKPGGFLVVQTDITCFPFPTTATRAWRPVANQAINTEIPIPGLLMPSNFSPFTNRIFVTQRLC